MIDLFVSQDGLSGAHWLTGGFGQGVLVTIRHRNPTPDPDAYLFSFNRSVREHVLKEKQNGPVMFSCLLCKKMERCRAHSKSHKNIEKNTENSCQMRAPRLAIGWRSVKWPPRKSVSSKARKQEHQLCIAQVLDVNAAAIDIRLFRFSCLVREQVFHHCFVRRSARRIPLKKRRPHFVKLDCKASCVSFAALLLNCLLGQLAVFSLHPWQTDGEAKTRDLCSPNI